VKIKAVIFDLFQTLVDFSFNQYNQVLAAMAVCLKKNPEAFVSSWHASWAQHEAGAFKKVADYIVAVSGPVALESSLLKAVALHEAFQKQVLIPHPETIAVLKDLKSAGYKTGLVTNCPVETPILWSRSQLSPLIDVAVFSTLEQTRKPDSAMFLSCLDRLRLAPAECAYVGDGANQELVVSSALGMHTIKLTNGVMNPEEGNSAWGGPTIARLADLFAYIK